MYLNERGRSYVRPELPRRRLQLRAKLSLTETGSSQAKQPAPHKGLLQVAGLGAAPLAFQARAREAGRARAAAPGTCPRAPGVRRPLPASFALPFGGLGRCARGAEFRGETSVGRLV